MMIEIIERQVNYEPVRIMLRRGIATGETRTVTYMQRVVYGAKVLRQDKRNISVVDSSVLRYAAILEKRGQAILDSMDADNLNVDDFVKLLEIFK